MDMCCILSGRDFSGGPGSLAPRKSLKLTGNPCWNSQELLSCFPVNKFLFIRITSCEFKKIYTFAHFPRFLLIQFQAKYPADPVGSHEAKIKSHPAYYSFLITHRYKFEHLHKFHKQYLCFFSSCLTDQLHVNPITDRGQKVPVPPTSDRVK
jgi:hypothetical protein